MRRLRARLSWRAFLDRPAISEWLGLLLLAASLVSFPLERRLVLRIAAVRRLGTRVSHGLARFLLRDWMLPARHDTWRERKIGWTRYYGAFGRIADAAPLTTSLLLKEPAANGEKGVLYSSFEFNWMKIIANHDAHQFFRDYILVGASSWSPCDHAVFGSLQGLSDDPAFIGISNMADTAQYSLWSPTISPLPIMACDWIDPDMFAPLPGNERTTDILMVAHFARWKRHWLLFDALRRMRRDLNVVLIGRNAPGRTERDIRDEARAFGVRQDLDIRINQEIEEVIAEQCNARLSLAFSRREGSCVSVTESMFANTPVAMMSDAHIGSRAYINEATGQLVGRGNLARSLESMLERTDTFSPTFSPRAWALENIAARDTSARLNRILRAHCVAKGRPWTQDIAPLCWRYVPRYLDDADANRLQPGVERLRQRHGIVLEEFVSERDAAGRNNAPSAPLEQMNVSRLKRSG